MSLFQLLNQNSYLIAACAVWGVALVVITTRFRQMPAAWIALVLLALILIAGNLVFRVGVSEIETSAQFDQVLASDRPLVLEIYSNY